MTSNVLFEKNYDNLKKRLKYGKDGSSLRLMFKRFKATLCDSKADALSFRNFCHGLTRLGIRCAKEQKRQMFDKIDINGDGLITFREFQKAFFPQESTQQNHSGDFRYQSACDRLKRLQLYQDGNNLIKSPTTLYQTLKSQFVIKSKSQLGAFKKFLRCSGSPDTLISCQELKTACRFQSFRCAPFVIERLFAHLDADDNDQVTYEEFARALFDRDLTTNTDLDHPPRRKRALPSTKVASKQQICLASPFSPTDVSSHAIRELKSRIRQLSPKKLKMAMKKSVPKAAPSAPVDATDLLGLHEILAKSGVIGPEMSERRSLKALFYKADYLNRGYITFNQLAQASGIQIRNERQNRHKRLPNLKNNSYRQAKPSKYVRPRGSRRVH